MSHTGRLRKQQTTANVILNILPDVEHSLTNISDFLLLASVPLCRRRMVETRRAVQACAASFAVGVVSGLFLSRAVRRWARNHL